MVKGGDIVQVTNNPGEDVDKEQLDRVQQQQLDQQQQQFTIRLGLIHAVFPCACLLNNRSLKFTKMATRRTWGIGIK